MKSTFLAHFFEEVSKLPFLDVGKGIAALMAMLRRKKPRDCKELWTTCDEQKALFPGVCIIFKAHCGTTIDFRTHNKGDMYLDPVDEQPGARKIKGNIRCEDHKRFNGLFIIEFLCDNHMSVKLQYRTGEMVEYILQ